MRRSPRHAALRWALLTSLLLGCGDDAASTLAIMDADWARLAFRQPAPTVQTEESSS